MPLKLIVPVFVLSLSSAASLASAQEHQHHPAAAGLVDVPLQREGFGHVVDARCNDDGGGSWADVGRLAVHAACGRLRAASVMRSHAACLSSEA